MRGIPTPLILGIIVSILLFSFLGGPAFKKYQDSKAKLVKAESTLSSQKSKLLKLKELPSFETSTYSVKDAVLVFKMISDKKWIKVASVESALKKDKNMQYINFSFETEKNDRQKELIVLLERLKTSFPIAYTDYDMQQNTIKITGRFYIL